ncbi:MAG: PepSY-associated TM helix domain-containing protein [Pseudomonadota bacterium]
MKPTTIKTFLDVHTWTGLGAGLALFIAFYTGAITVFTHELDIWDQYSVPAHSEQNYAMAEELLQRVLSAEPASAESLRLELSSEDHPGNIARWYQRLEDGSYTSHEFRLTGEDTLDTAPNSSNLAGFIYVLHYTAGLPSSFGLYVLGIICVIYGIALVSGLIVFLPNMMKDLFVVRSGHNKKRFWLDAHNVVGVMSLPWHIMFAWSSALLAIGVFLLAPFQWMVFDDDLMPIVGPELGRISTLAPSGNNAPMLSVSEIVHITQKEVPGLEPTQLRYSHAGDANATVRVIGKTRTENLDPWASLILKANNGDILNVSHPDNKSPGATFYDGLVALHFVSFGGYLAKWVYLLLGLAGAFLFYSGNLLWIESRRKRRKLEQLRSTVFLARLNSGVCIGCMAGVSAAFLTSRGLSGFAERANMMELSYYLVFFASILWSFLRPVAVGTRELLLVCGMLTLAIPIFDALFLDTSAVGYAIAGHWIVLVTDIVAILAAAAFFWIANTVNKRAKYGDPNSVWSSSSHGARADQLQAPTSEITNTPVQH